MCADQKKRKKETTDKGGGGWRRAKKKKQVNVMNYSKGVGCTPEVSALWPLWQEVKGTTIAAGINRADYLDSKSCRTGWQRYTSSAPAIGNVYFCRYQIHNKYFNSILCPFSWCPSWAKFFLRPAGVRSGPLTPTAGRREWVIFSPLSTTCAVLLQNPCGSRNSVSNLSHKRRQSQYAREQRRIPGQESHRKLSYVWLYTACTVNGGTV